MLPELATLGISQTIVLAIRRHENLTGTFVSQKLHVNDEVEVPITVRICAYWVVQEALNIAYRHGGGDGQKVVASIEAGWLHLEVINSANTRHAHTSSSEHLAGVTGQRSADYVPPPSATVIFGVLSMRR